jgi:hypothetical protein
MSKSDHNEGIIIQNGTINAGSLAVGRNARAVSAERSERAVRIGAEEAAGSRREPARDRESPRDREPAPDKREWDAFISHASEDKRDFVEPLARALQQKGLKIWYDDFTLTVGMSLRESIDSGLARSHYGIVVLSRNFFAKDWTHWELNGLMTKEVGGVRVILPIWHNVTQEQVRNFSPLMADRVAARSVDGLDKVVEQLVRAVTPQN